jgi:hypothetical protein
MSESVNARPPLLTAIALSALSTLAGSAGAAIDSGTGVGFTSAPQRVVQGNTVTVALSVQPAGSRCTLEVRYANGARQKGLRAVRAARGRATWRWRLSIRTGAGLATMTARCGTAGTAYRTMLVVGAVIPARITVEKKGFSIRAHPYGGSTVSYGVILENHSPTREARDVTVLVNFVMPDDRLIGSSSTTISEIDAKSQFAHGSDISFPGVPPIERLAIVIQVRETVPASSRRPAVSHVRVIPDRYDPSWVGSVEGELHNDDRAVLERSWLSTVVFDAEGNVLGGGNGFAFISIPPAAREFFKISSGMSAINFGRAASAMVSVAPTYRS